MIAVGEVLLTLTDLVIVAVVFGFVGLIVVVLSVLVTSLGGCLVLVNYSHGEVGLLMDAYPGELCNKIVPLKSLLFKGALLEGVLCGVCGLQAVEKDRNLKVIIQSLLKLS
jgi:hypothetical protein